jgi:hypothetical protein
LPAVTACELGDADRVKSGGGTVTVNVMLAECVRLPLAPVTVSVKLPAGVEFVVLTVRVADPGAVTETGLKLAVAPEGSPLALNATLPVKPEIALMVNV